ncbi:MAG TPA: trehalose-6-phosphate synthase [Acidimicrobiia bacterium]|nr:trehalose-6-phosphate synthase [Acidimicrobiia bacterium]
MILVSHRGPFRFTREPDGTFSRGRGAGGVVTALGPLLARDAPVTWIAAAITDDDIAAASSGATSDLGLELHMLDLDEQLHRMHYDVVSNSVLWYVHHDLFDRVHRPQFDDRFREAWDAYVAVNATFADAASDAATEGDIVLVQDYQLALVPELLRARRPDLRVAHFTHTPFAGADALRVLPTDVAERLCESLAGGPAGFHTGRWRDAYRQSAANAPTFVASLGPDAAALQEAAAEPGTRVAADALADVVGERLVVLRTDRIEPSKNIIRGFAAFDRLLEARPGLRGRVVFVAMVYASRQHLADYLAYANEIQHVVARINDRWATRDWTPIVLDERDDFTRTVAGLQRYDVLFVNPIKDGLNLVAKEGPVLNRRDGIVCLSREAGAFEELRDSVLALHPFDIEQMAVALDDALAMPLDERGARAEAVRNAALSRTPAMWLDDQLQAAVGR